MKTAEKIASGWLLLLGFVFLLLPVSTVDRGSQQNQNMPICSTPNVNEARDSAIGGLILGVPSVLLGGWLALGAYRQGQQEKKAIAQQAGATYLDLFSQFADQDGQILTEYTTDGIHLSAQGYAAWQSVFQESSSKVAVSPTSNQ